MKVTDGFRCQQVHGETGKDAKGKNAPSSHCHLSLRKETVQVGTDNWLKHQCITINSALPLKYVVNDPCEVLDVQADSKTEAKTTEKYNLADC